MWTDCFLAREHSAGLGASRNLAKNESQAPVGVGGVGVELAVDLQVALPQVLENLGSLSPNSCHNVYHNAYPRSAGA